MMLLPLFTTSVSAGFPSPADDYLENLLSLDDYLIEQPAATVFVRVAGLSMLDAGVLEQDILVVNRALTPAAGDFVVACLNNDFTLKIFQPRDNRIELLPANPDYPLLVLNPDGGDYIFGVVSAIVRKLR